MRDDSTKLSWGTLIPNNGSNKKKIIHDFKDLNLNVLRKTMNAIFFHRTNTALQPTTKPDMFAIDPDTDPTDKIIFFRRVRANMIEQRIYNSLSPTSLASLKSKKIFTSGKQATVKSFMMESPCFRSLWRRRNHQLVSKSLN